MVATLMACPHNIQQSPIGTLRKKGQYDHPQEEDYMAHSYAHDPSIFDHLSPPTTKLRKVRPCAHIE